MVETRRCPVAGAATGAAGRGQHPGHTGVGGRSGATRRIRRRGGRPHHRWRGVTRGSDGDPGAGSRWPGAAHRWTVRGERRDRHGRLFAVSRRPRRGHQVGVHDSRLDCRGPAVGWGVGALSPRMVNLDGVFRREWGPAVAALARWSGDLTVAEDAVQEAFAEALRTWPRDGVPDNPGGWVLTVARNRARDRLRRGAGAPGKELAAGVDH